MNEIDFLSHDNIYYFKSDGWSHNNDGENRVSCRHRQYDYINDVLIIHTRGPKIILCRLLRAADVSRSFGRSHSCTLQTCVVMCVCFFVFVWVSGFVYLCKRRVQTFAWERACKTRLGPSLKKKTSARAGCDHHHYHG